jgi:hypothetical protein
MKEELLVEITEENFSDFLEKQVKKGLIKQYNNPIIDNNRNSWIIFKNDKQFIIEYCNESWYCFIQNKEFELSNLESAWNLVLLIN